MYQIACISVMTGICFFATLAQGDIAAFNKQLGRGINMGNMLEAPVEGEWGQRLDTNYFKIIADKGFNSVRIPIRWSGRGRLELKPPYRVSPEFFERVDQAVNAALKAHLAVIINWHHFDELFTDPEAQRDRFLAAWQQISSHYRAFPPGLAFEILNEPNGKLTPSKWNSLFCDTLAIIRRTNPERPVLIGTAEWGGVGAAEHLEIPKHDKNIILTVHYYNPFHLTHQDAGWVGKESRKWLGTTWRGTYAEKLAVMNEMSAVKAFADAKGIPVHVGEFGAYSRADIASRARWTAYCARLFEKLGFSWAYWEFCAGFGAYDPVAGEWRHEIADALISDDTSILNPGPAPTGRDTRSDIIANGDFSQGMKQWTFGAWQGTATGGVSNGVFTARIADPGVESWNIQLLQNDLKYHDGTIYKISFEAWAENDRSISVGAENGVDYTSYGSRSFNLTRTPRAYAMSFVKSGKDDHGRISFSLGTQAATVHIRNIHITPSNGQL